MRVARRKPSLGVMTKHELLLNERMRAPTVQQLFPEVAQLRIELDFSEHHGRASPPSSQLHTLYGGASAFFRFRCPCADCDGDFDLTDSVAVLVRSRVNGNHTVLRTGQFGCQGVQFRSHPSLEAACPIQVKFRLRIELKQAA
jgi:hypothetical protein